MSFRALYDFITVSFTGIVTSLSNFLVSLLVTPFPQLLTNLSLTEGLPTFVSTALKDLSALISGVAMFNAPLLVVLLGTFLIFYVVLAIVRWLIP